MTPRPSRGRGAAACRLTLAILALAFLGGCTPVGAWLYEDPRLNLVEVARDTISAEPRLEFVFDGCNNNDYDLQTDSLATALVIGGQLAGQNQETSTIILPSRTVLRLSVKVPTVPMAGSDGSHELPFSLTNKAVVVTPEGPKHLTLIQSGTVTLKDGWPVGWRLHTADPCRPGQSKLPAAAGRGNGRPVYVPPPPPPVIPGQIQ